MQRSQTCFLKDSLQSIVTPNRLTEDSEVIQWPLRLIYFPEVSCFVFVKMMALNLSGFTITELVWNQSIVKFNFSVNEFNSSGTVSLTADTVLSSAKLRRSFSIR